MIAFNPIRIIPGSIDWAEPLEDSHEPRKSARLLLVDDDPVFCRSMMRTAEKHGFELQVCQNIGEVLKLHQEKPFDAAVLDYQFGDLTAQQVGHFLAEETPIIITSNHHRSVVNTAGWPFDIRDFISKSKGNVAILKRALGIGMASEVDRESRVKAHSTFKPIWLMALAATILAGLFLQWPRMAVSVEESPILWDALSKTGNHAMKKANPQES